MQNEIIIIIWRNRDACYVRLLKKEKKSWVQLCPSSLFFFFFPLSLPPDTPLPSLSLFACSFPWKGYQPTACFGCSWLEDCLWWGWAQCESFTSGEPVLSNQRAFSLKCRHKQDLSLLALSAAAALVQTATFRGLSVAFCFYSATRTARQGIKKELNIH